MFYRCPSLTSWYIVVDFTIIGRIEDVETFAKGHGIRELSRLNRTYGEALWRKRKGRCRVRLRGGSEMNAEVHWYEATGIGKKELKIKRYL